MGIIDKIRSIFIKKQQTKQTPQSTNITRYDTSLIIIPEYTELSEEDRATVDGYISEVDMERLDTLIFYADEMSRYATANTDLLVKLFERITERPLSEFELSKLSQNELCERRIDTLIQREQVGLYRHGLQALERESALRATALVEIAKRESKRRLDFLGLFGRAERIKRKSQTELLELVIERMKISKKIIEQQIQAVSNAEQNETTIASSIETYNAITKTDEAVSQTVLRQRVADILQMAYLVIPDEAQILKEINANTTEEHIVKILARVQRKLDVYAYTHRKEIEQIRQEVLEIGQLEKTTENREKLLRRINHIQIMYKVFGQYITPEDLQSLYQAKFDVLITGINEQEESPFIGIADKDELAYYTKIIQEKLEAILTDKNEEFIKVFGKNKTQAFNILKKIIKSDNGGDFSAERILTKSRLIQAILAFETEEGFENFFYNSKAFNEADLVEHLDNGTIEWEDKLTLETICELERILGNLDERSIKKISPWVNLVLISKLGIRCRIGTETDQKEYGDWFLPEGITAISFTSGNLHTNPYESKLIELLREIPYYLRVVCPSTLKKIKSPEYLSSPSNITEIELNEGLEEIENNAFANYGFRNIFFPASLNKVGQGAFEGCKKLMFIRMKGSLSNIGYRAFANCENLQEVTFNEGLRQIGDGAFMGCTELKRVEFPGTLRNIGSGAFEGCERLEEVIINEGLEEIGERAFDNTPSLKLVSVPQNKINGHNIFGDLRRNFDAINDGKLKKYRNFSLRIRGININKDLLQTYKQYTLAHNFEDDNDRQGIKAYFLALMRMKYGKYEDAFNLEIKNIELMDGETKFLTYELKKAQTCDDVLREINQLIEQRKPVKEEK